MRGRVHERVRHGLLELVLDVPDGEQLLRWAATPHYPLDGSVSFYQENDMMARESVAFSGGQCVHYQETFEAGAELIGSYRCALTIAAPRLELRTGGAAGAYVPPAARAYAAPVAAAAGVAAAVAASPAHWLDTLVEQLNAGPDARKTVNKWLAAGVNEDKLRAAMQRPDFQQTFIRLAVASKGVYLAGGDNQLFLPNNFTRSADFGTRSTDVTSPNNLWLTA